MKKVRLNTTQSDTKIFREVNALSRLSHRFIVRYYTTWVETSEPTSTAASDDDDSEDRTESGLLTPSSGSTSGSRGAVVAFSDNISFSLDDLDEASANASSFPSIHFSRSSSPSTTEEEDEEESGDGGFGNLFAHESSQPKKVVTTRAPPTPPVLSRTLYIQMVGGFADSFLAAACSR